MQNKAIFRYLFCFGIGWGLNWKIFWKTSEGAFYFMSTCRLQWDWLAAVVRRKDVLKSITTTTGVQYAIMGSMTQQQKSFAALLDFRTFTIQTSVMMYCNNTCESCSARCLFIKTGVRTVRSSSTNTNIRSIKATESSTNITKHI